MNTEIYRGARVLLTGHTGFKGSWLSIWLQRLGSKVTGLALDPPTQPNLFTEANVGGLVTDLRGDIRNLDDVAEAVRQAEPDVVFHLAAQPLVRLSYNEPKYTFDTNVGGTVNVLEALRASKSVRAIVVVTSDKCYENREWPYAYRESDPLGGRDPYSASKGAAEIVAASYARSFFDGVGVPLATARAGNVIGGGDWAADRIIPDAVRALQDGQPVPVRNPDAVRPWQHVLEPLCGYLALGACLLARPDGIHYAEAWNFAPAASSCQPVRALISAFIQHYGTGAWTDLSDKQVQAPHEANLLALAADKAFRRLGWRPRWDFGQAVQHASSWYRRHGGGESALDLCIEDIESYIRSES